MADYVTADQLREVVADATRKMLDEVRYTEMLTAIEVARKVVAASAARHPDALVAAMVNGPLRVSLEALDPPDSVEVSEG